MRNIKINIKEIAFSALPGTDLNLVLAEAKAFIEFHNIPECEVEKDGFTMLIEADTDLCQLAIKYIRWSINKPLNTF